MVRSTSSFSVQLPSALIRAAHDNAQRAAAMAGDFLLAAGIVERGPDGRICAPDLSPVLALELAALMHLREWKRTGLLYHLAAGLPDPDAALEDIASRLDEGDQRFSIIQDATLWGQVNDVLCFDIAWEGREIFQADIVMRGLNDDELVDALADYLWAQRHSYDRETTNNEAM